MLSEKEKMKMGQWYDANNDSELLDTRIKAQDLCFELNQLKPSNENERKKLICQLLGCYPQDLVLLSPFTCDYGVHIHIGKNVFININNYFMDGADITIGDNVFIGPSCGFYTANHPLDYKNRNKGLEKALPITIGNNVWIGANVSIMPGVIVGDGCVIAANTVVTKNIKSNSLVAGVPARIIREIKQ
ncbi:sugar O-acetyltransferase [Allocoprobacillus halotolerans]|uniref:Acetyltransferase n=1 Tax=Allocoprobacillus halotolerans TaxID=2944914 RepID=A0ABY5I129_9FIRM|nr:sugar O-acetyltransferase [Allocoprobacillus halotolerans]UTY39071.1 sugar O-acetyltransferase [Allocoprobacillus halotolerans]